MINIKDLSFSYKRNKPLFDHLDLTLEAGHIYGLLGKNGAGKTTLLKIISGLLFPHEGKVEVSGFIPMKRQPDFLSEIFVVPEEFMLPALTIENYVKLYSQFYPRFNYNLFDEFALEFRLPCNQKLTKMSYGQKKKFLISFGIAADSKVMIMDEPTNGLDIPSKSQFRKTIANSFHEERIFIISTHQVREMENLIDPIIILDEAKIVFLQDTASISEKLAFTKQAEIPQGENVFYHESGPGGYSAVSANENGKESRINIELLFNAVLENREKILESFNN